MCCVTRMTPPRCTPKGPNPKRFTPSIQPSVIRPSSIHQHQQDQSIRLEFLPVKLDSRVSPQLSGLGERARAGKLLVINLQSAIHFPEQPCLFMSEREGGQQLAEESSRSLHIGTNFNSGKRSGKSQKASTVLCSP